MSPFTMAISNIASLKTLEQEIVEALDASKGPISCADLNGIVASRPDRETISREVFRLAMEGVIVKVGDIPAPQGVPRKTVAVYGLPAGKVGGISAAVKPNTEHQENPMATARAAQAKKLAEDLGVSKAVPARGTRASQPAKDAKKAALATPAAATKRGSRAGRGALHRQVLECLQSAETPMAATQIAEKLKLRPQQVMNAMTNIVKAGLVDSTKTGRIKAYFLVGETPPPANDRPSPTAKSQQNAAKSPEATPGIIPEAPPTARVLTPAFRCAIASDGSMLFLWEGSGEPIELKRDEVAIVVDYLRKIDYQQEAA